MVTDEEVFEILQPNCGTQCTEQTLEQENVLHLVYSLETHIKHLHLEASKG